MFRNRYRNINRLRKCMLNTISGHVSACPEMVIRTKSETIGMVVEANIMLPFRFHSHLRWN